MEEAWRPPLQGLLLTLQLEDAAGGAAEGRRLKSQVCLAILSSFPWLP